MVLNMKSIIIYFQIFLLAFFIGCHKNSKTSSQESEKPTKPTGLGGKPPGANDITSVMKIGVIQYNVKYDTRGQVWGVEDFRKKEVQAIEATMRSHQVDFIALEQAPNDLPEKTDKWPLSPSLDSLLPDDLKSNWETVPGNGFVEGDFKSYDGTQITYNKSKWKITGDLKTGVSGYWKGNYDREEQTLTFSGKTDVRPYSAVYFANIENPNVKLVFVATHFPHPPANDWNWSDFKSEILRLIGEKEENKLKTTTIVMSGDFNEASGVYQNIENFKALGDFKFLKTKENTCCRNNDFVQAFDYVGVSNGGEFGENSYHIIPNTGDISKVPANKEHKAVYVQVTLN